MLILDIPFSQDSQWPDITVCPVLPWWPQPDKEPADTTHPVSQRESGGNIVIKGVNKTEITIYIYIYIYTIKQVNLLENIFTLALIAFLTYI